MNFNFCNLSIFILLFNALGLNAQNIEIDTLKVEKIDLISEKSKFIQKLDSIHSYQEKLEILDKEENEFGDFEDGTPVLFFEDTIFYIYSDIGPFSSEDRSAKISSNLESLVSESNYSASFFSVDPKDNYSNINYDSTLVLSITNEDAQWIEKDKNDLANQYVSLIKNAFEKHNDNKKMYNTLSIIGLVLLVLLVFFFGIKFLNKGFNWLSAKILIKSKDFVTGVKFKDYEFLSIDREISVLKWFLNVLKWITIAIVFYMLLPVLFSIFPATKGIANTLFGYILNPLKDFGISLISYIPELITIVIIVLLTQYFLRFLKFLSIEVERGKLELPGFYPDWAGPTYNLLRIVIFAFSFIIIFPYLPGSDSAVFQGVSVFLGILISLGSSSAISNIIAGLVITYMRAFKVGDRVKIGETTGDIIAKTMLVTRVRTIKNEDVTIPNSAIMTGTTINYSSSSLELGLILNSTVTIGYDVPWRTVHQLLIDSAIKTEFIKAEPIPFVLQTSLDDFYVSYQVNAYTENAGLSSKIYSELHANIQDAFNEAGIEILSPHYRAERDGNNLTVSIK